jgi:hypothetical protein
MLQREDTHVRSVGRLLWKVSCTTFIADTVAASNTHVIYVTAPSGMNTASNCI